MSADIEKKGINPILDAERERGGIKPLPTRKKPQGPQVLSEIEHTIWDAYNNEAKKMDSESVNDWRDSLGTLLLFVSRNAALLYV